MGIRTASAEPSKPRRLRPKAPSRLTAAAGSSSVRGNFRSGIRRAMRTLILVFAGAIDGAGMRVLQVRRWRTRPPPGPFLLALPLNRTERRDDPDGDRHERDDDRRRDGDPRPAGPGGRASLRLSGRRRAADLRRALPPGQGQAHPRAPRAGRGPRGGRLRPLVRQGRRGARHLGARCDQRGDRAHRRDDGFDPARLHHRSGADPPHRLGRVPGMRHGRHHPPLHEAQLPREIDRGPAAHPARGLLRGRERPARSGGRRPAEGHPVQERALRAPEQQPAQDLPARREGRHRAHQGGASS